MNNQVYKLITDRIVAEMRKGNIPWKQPWTSQFPANFVSKKRYSGFNFFYLYMMTLIEGYPSAYYLTYKQIHDQGGRLKANQHGYPVIFWKVIEVEDKDTKEKKEFPMLRYYTVFNVSQAIGLKKPVTKPLKRLLKADAVLKLYSGAPKIVQHPSRAFYNQASDTISLPALGQFNSASDYYGTLFHELTHSTGVPSRLKRFDTQGGEHSFGSSNYAKEELVAELGSAFLCANTGIDNSVRNSAAYIQSWIGALESDPRLLINAAAKAQRSTNFILGIKPNDKKKGGQ